MFVLEFGKDKASAQRVRIVNDWAATFVYGDKVKTCAYVVLWQLCESGPVPLMAWQCVE